MMEKTLILKHISGVFCLLNSYSKFTQPERMEVLTCSFEYYIMNAKENKRSQSGHLFSCIH